MQRVQQDLPDLPALPAQQGLQGPPVRLAPPGPKAARAPSGLRVRLAQSVQWDLSVPRVKLEDPDPEEPSGR